LTDKRHKTLRFATGILLALYIFLALPVFLLSFLLVFIAETVSGFLFGVALIVLLFACLVLVLLFYAKKRKKRFLQTATGGGLVVLLLLTICYFLTPDGTTSGNFKSYYFGNAYFHRWSPSNLVPEIDQLKMGTYIFSFIDPIGDSIQAKRIRSLFLKQYCELCKNDDFVNAGSALGLCYSDFFTGKRPVGHFYEYIPKHSEKKLPVIIFLHGCLGNFKGYMWCWKKFADKNDFAIIAPTFGAGDWNKPGGIEIIQNTLDYCRKNQDIDENRIYLAGVSNGAKGITRSILMNDIKNVRGVIYISPMLEKNLIMTKRFVEKCGNRKILVLHGIADKRIPIAYIKQQIRYLENHKSVIKTIYYCKEDHFLMYSKWPELSKNIEEWIKRK